MALILNIDTATENASVGLSKNGQTIQFLENPDQKNHAAFVQPAIQHLMQLAGFELKQLDAVSVSAGPGSYTGLRVGLASAKGLCYACDKPLIMVNTLLIIALAIKESAQNTGSFMICPMIDARRNEVFTALYDAALHKVMQPQALILTEEAFKNELEKQPILFGGSGSVKAAKLISHGNTVFSEVKHTSAHLGQLAEQGYANGSFADLAYCEPFYCKEFFSPLV